MKEEKWECGMNVRARFSEDGEYYEAIIEKLFDEYAVVRYLGKLCMWCRNYIDACDNHSIKFGSAFRL